MIAVKPINILFIVRLINRKTLFFNFCFIWFDRMHGNNLPHLEYTICQQNTQETCTSLADTMWHLLTPCVN